MTDSIDDVSPMEWDTLRRRAEGRPPSSATPAGFKPDEYTVRNGVKVWSKQPESDSVRQPNHYVRGGVECIEYIRQQLGDTHRAYLEGNVLKYVHRYKMKGKPLEDLRKAQVYLGWLIEELENE